MKIYPCYCSMQIYNNISFSQVKKQKKLVLKLLFQSNEELILLYE